MNKTELLNEVVLALQNLLTQAVTAAENAHKAATDDQSVAETQYDTLAIEASYLAEGQSRRIDELKAQIQQLEALQVETEQLDVANSQVSLGSLVWLDYDNGEYKKVFVLPCGAGIQLEVEGEKVLVVTPNAPLAKAILNKTVDDDFEIVITGQNGVSKTQTGFIAQID